MQRVLRKRMLRDLKVNALRYLALSLMIIMGMFLVITIVGSAQNLTNGTIDLAKEHNLENGEFTLFIPLTKNEKEDIEEMGVTIENEHNFDFQTNDKYKSTIRIFPVREEINTMEYTDGKSPEADDEIAMEKRFAEIRGLTVGDFYDIGDKKYKITGVGCTPDYDGPYKSLSDTSINSKYFGMVFMTTEGYKAFRKSKISNKSEEYLYAYKLSSDADEDELKDYLTDIKISSELVDDEYFQEYWERTGGVGDDLEDAMKELSDATDEVNDGLKELSDNNETLNDGTKTIFNSVLDSVNSSLSDAGLDTTLTEDNFKEELDRLIADSDSSVMKIALRDAKNQLSTLHKYKKGVKKYTDGVGELHDGVSEMKDGVDELDAAIDDAMDEFDFSLSNLTMFLKQADNPRIFATKNDKAVDISVGMIAGVILLILMAYVISVFVIHSIEKECSIIGTLYSMGVTKNDLMLHYVSLPVIITFFSGLIGALFASTGVLVPLISDSSYQYFSIPYFKFTIPGYLWIYSLVIPPIISIIVNVIVINKNLNRTALSLIRNEKKANKIHAIDLSKMGFVSAFRIRQMMREMRSGIAVILGMLISLMVFMIGVDCYLLCTHIADDYKNDVKYEHMYSLKYPEEEVPKDAEPAFAYTCKKENLGFNFDITILGIEKDNPYFDVNIKKSKQDIVVSSALAQKFKVSTGDDFLVNDEEKNMKYAFKVKDVTNYSPGFYIFMNIDSMREMFGESDNYYNTLFSDEEIDIEAGRLYVTTNRDDIVKGANVFSELMMPMIYVLSIASIIIFCVVMYLMMKVMIDRSAINISLIKVFGYRRKEIKKLYIDGNTYIVALGALICIPLSKLLMNNLFPFMVSNVACSLNLKAPIYFYIILYGAVMLLYTLTSSLLVRRLENFTPAEILKNRE